ncbi:MAG: hypothetical protein MUO92_03375 [Dehalococcoidales bacterium]|nr:hypothetical protein [Dehalococcoidales bacterium]
MWILATIGAIVFISATPVAWIAWKRKKEGKIIYKSTPSSLTVFIIVFGTVIGLSVLGSCGGEPPVTQYTLTINIDGSGTPVGADAYDEGTVVSISANPDPEWEFAEWTGGINTISDRLSSSTTIVMDGDYAITARFRLQVITPTNISNVGFNPQWPATLNYGEWVAIEFNYFIDETFPVYITPRPFSNGALAPGYLASGSNQYNSFRGKGKSDFTINLQLGQVIVDQIRFQIAPLHEGAILYEFLIPVSYTFQ